MSSPRRPQATGRLGPEGLESLGRVIARGAASRPEPGRAAAPRSSAITRGVPSPGNGRAGTARRALPGGGAADRERARRRRRARLRRNRLVAGSVFCLLVGGVLFASIGSRGGLDGPAAAGTAKTQKIPPPVLTSLVSSRRVVPGAAPVLSWPHQGEAAVGVQGMGLVGQSPDERSVPIASLTKLMTAYLVLQDHPLQPGQQGPSLTMTQADVAAWETASESDDSNAPVKAGEVLTEFQLLEALLIPSADNIADRLGVWVAGSDTAFVAEMNATAHQLGLLHTHYADASGVDPGSRSTAADQAKLAALLMEQPVVRQIVAHPSVPFPVAGTLWNYNPALGVDGIVGIKSGFTSEAQGCLATAAYRVVGGHRVLVVTVSLGQPDGLYGAARTDEGLLTQASKVLEPVTVLHPDQEVARLRVPWSATELAAVASSGSGLTVVGWPHLVLRESLEAVSGATLAADAAAPSSTSTTGSPGASPSSSVPVSGDQSRRSARAGGDQAASTVVGTLQVSGPSGLVASVPLSTSAPIPVLPAGWAPSSS